MLAEYLFLDKSSQTFAFRNITCPSTIVTFLSTTSLHGVRGEAVVSDLFAMLNHFSYNQWAFNNITVTRFSRKSTTSCK